mmetsp:Transcript_15537/g.52439  ORF Transcript_15537/g.52439 Transcript_15537/m.52439 type:complete len:202 (+) Transcript_15537:3107-3712(+)
MNRGVAGPRPYPALGGMQILLGEETDGKEAKRAHADQACQVVLDAIELARLDLRPELGKLALGVLPHVRRAIFLLLQHLLQATFLQVGVQSLRRAYLQIHRSGDPSHRDRALEYPGRSLGRVCAHLVQLELCIHPGPLHIRPDARALVLEFRGCHLQSALHVRLDHIQVALLGFQGLLLGPRHGVADRLLEEILHRLRLLG